LFFFFFFQAEDGIRDLIVTGVQTCALPILIERVPADFADHPDFAGAPHLIEFAIDQGWYNPASGPFDANAVYGDGRGAWQGAAWMTGELAARAARPEHIGLADVMWAVRTERLTGDS